MASDLLTGIDPPKSASNTQKFRSQIRNFGPSRRDGTLSHISQGVAKQKMLHVILSSDMVLLAELQERLFSRSGQVYATPLYPPLNLSWRVPRRTIASPSFHSPVYLPIPPNFNILQLLIRGLFPIWTRFAGARPPHFSLTPPAPR